jgi:hypothetical protein
MQSGMSETASVGRAGWPRPRPRIPLEEPRSRGSGGMASLGGPRNRLRPAVQRPADVAREDRYPASAGAAVSRRDVSTLNIRPRRLRPAWCGWDVPGFPVRPSTRGRTTLPTARAGVSRPQALREEPRLRPAFGCRRRGPARTFGSGGSRDLPGTSASAPPRWFAAGRVDALHAGSPDRGLSSDPDIPRGPRSHRGPGAEIRQDLRVPRHRRPSGLAAAARWRNAGFRAGGFAGILPGRGVWNKF